MQTRLWRCLRRVFAFSCTALSQTTHLSSLITIRFNKGSLFWRFSSKNDKSKFDWPNSPWSIYEAPKHWDEIRIQLAQMAFDAYLGNTYGCRNLLHRLREIRIDNCLDISWINLVRVTRIDSLFNMNGVINIKITRTEFCKPLLTHAFYYGIISVYTVYLSLSPAARLPF